MIIIPAIPSFTASEHFVIDTSGEARVKISRLDRKVEGDGGAAEELAINKLLGYAHDPAIITALGGGEKVEITLGQFFVPFAKQPKGEDGPLLTNGDANVDYIRDEDGVLWAVHGLWCTVGWHFGASLLGDPREWNDGEQFLSR